MAIPVRALVRGAEATFRRCNGFSGEMRARRYPEETMRSWLPQLMRRMSRPIALRVGCTSSHGRGFSVLRICISDVHDRSARLAFPRTTSAYFEYSLVPHWLKIEPHFFHAAIRTCRTFSLLRHRVVVLPDKIVWIVWGGFTKFYAPSTYGRWRNWRR